MKNLPEHIKNNVGKWDVVYSGVNTPFPLGVIETYKIGMEFLSDCNSVEDWGCGIGFAKQYCNTKYIGIDGSKSINTDIVCDLRYYTSITDGIFLRHVLDHNVDWELILNNAINSATKKISLITASKSRDKTELIRIIENRDIVDIEFNCEDIKTILKLHGLEFSEIKCDNEVLLLISK